MVQGNSNKEIAQELGISPRTVEIHRGNMMRKLKARSTSDAIRLAVYAGLDEVEGPQSIAA
jgi:two-component system response regulator FixJ